MKKTGIISAFITAALLAGMCGSVSAMEPNADGKANDGNYEVILGYDEPLYKKAKAYEKAGKYVHALATYWDAMLAAPVPENGEASLIAYDNLCEIIRNGKPGKDIKFDEFDLYDGWVALWNEYVDYWTANNSYYFTAKSPTRESLNMDAHTATYKSAIIPQRSMKFIDITRILQEGNEKSRTAEWKSIPADFENSISSKIPSYTDYVIVFDLIGGDGQRLCTSKSFTPRVETRAEKYVTVYNGTYGLGETYTWYDGPSFTVDSKTMKIIDAGDTWIKPVSLTCKGKKIPVYSVDWSFSERSFSEEWEKKGILVDIEGTRDGIWGGIEFDAPYRTRCAKERRQKEKAAQAEKERQEKAEKEKAEREAKLEQEIKDKFAKASEQPYITVSGASFSMDYNGKKISVNSFAIGVTEVTIKQFNDIKDMSPLQDIRKIGPVQVNWYDAIKFCNLKSIEEGLTPCYSIGNNSDTSKWGRGNFDYKAEDVECNFSANGWRLPTEAEWEYAAKGGQNKDSFKYSGSDNINDVAWYFLNSNKEVHPVAQKEPNTIGLYDMTGNVSEWCWDKKDSCRACRGGSYNDSNTSCEISKTNDTDPYYAICGFRIVRTISAETIATKTSQKSSKSSKEVSLGFTPQTLTKDIRKQINISDKKVKGVVVREIKSGSPASKMNLKDGDVITAVNGKKITDEKDFKDAVNNKKNKTLTFDVNRNGMCFKTEPYTIR